MPPYNGSGSFSAPGSDFPAVPSTLIESSKFNAIINDIATGLSTAICKDGQQTITADIPFSGRKITGLGAGATNGDAVRYEQVLLLAGGTITGTVNIPDSFLLVTGSSDATKKFRFEADGITAGQTRVVTVADRDMAIGKYPTQQRFTSGSGTYSTPAGALYIRVRAVGGGGGGGSAIINNGTAGGNTTFGTLTAAGGALGTNGGGAGGAGGAATNGDVNITGGSGEAGSANGAESFSGGNGGSSAFGGGGGGGASGTGGDNAGANSGGGGGGGGQSSSNSGGGGGAGGYLEKLITAPDATYAYAVGAGGAGGSAGGTAGGNGAAGIIIVDEFYS